MCLRNYIKFYTTMSVTQTIFSNYNYLSYPNNSKSFLYAV